MGLYWSLVSKADDFNEYTGIDGAFDNCRVGGKMMLTMVDGVMTKIVITMDSKWSVAFMLNFIVYLCLTISALCMVFSPFVWPFAYGGNVLFCCA